MQAASGCTVQTWIARAVVLAALLCLNACAMVGVIRVKPHEVVNERRADVIGVGRLSDGTVQTLNVVALTAKSCAQAFTACTDIVRSSPGLDDEQRLSALAELWIGRATKTDHAAALDAATLDAYLQSARYAYAYLFFTARRPSARVFDLRQVQVIGFYNYAVQRALQGMFVELPKLRADWAQSASSALAGWNVLRPDTDVKVGGTIQAPAELLPAADLRFKGLRNVYQRDGFGSTFVAVAPPEPPEVAVPWRAPDYVSMTGVLTFGGDTLAQVLATKQVQLLSRDPYRDDSIAIGGHDVPLGANFTAAYGVWLARSGFASQSIRSLLGREGGIQTPRVLLMQPYDPDRLTVVMLHGLASSPEAWINVANEVMGDEKLRRHYQVWEVYYPTNAPIPVNLANIRQALDATLRHFDPGGHARASHDMMLVGHSMGGVIARLLVSSSDDKLWNVVPVRANLSAAKRARVRERLARYFHFTPMPQVSAAVFLAAPHRGTPVARYRLARWIGNLIRLPINVLKEVASLSDLLQDASGKMTPIHVSNSVDNLSDTNPFIVAAANLPIAPNVHYHSIIGVYKPKGPLATTSDGVVPYTSAHLAGADSELIIPSWHSVQDTPAAILELRRILRVHLTRVGEGGVPVAAPKQGHL